LLLLLYNILDSNQGVKKNADTEVFRKMSDENKIENTIMYLFRTFIFRIMTIYSKKSLYNHFYLIEIIILRTHIFNYNEHLHFYVLLFVYLLAGSHTISPGTECNNDLLQNATTIYRRHLLKLLKTREYCNMYPLF